MDSVDYWLLDTAEIAPIEAIPDIVQLYTAFSIGTLGITDITALTTRQIYGWLRLLEPRNEMLLPGEEPLFRGILIGMVLSLLNLTFAMRSSYLHVQHRNWLPNT